MSSSIQSPTNTRLEAQRDVIMGSQYNVTQYIDISAFRPPPNLAELRATYLTFLISTYHVLDFKGIPQLETFSRELSLEEVYVPLIARPEMPEGETWMRGRLAGRTLNHETLSDEMLEKAGKSGATAPIPIEKALGKHSRVIVLGDPGSGKSTLLKYLTLRLATEQNAPLPILLPLNAYARMLEKDDTISVQDYLPKYFAGQSRSIAALHSLFDTALDNGQAIILLDGLDEVQANRPRLVHKVEIFSAEASARGNKLVVTSRIVGYKDTPLDPKTWSLHTLLDFDSIAIEQFAERWCLAFEKSTLGDTLEAQINAEQEQKELLAALESSASLQRLASNPLLLTILALIKRQNVALPNRRVELYEIYLETLIRAWNKARSLDKAQVGEDINTNEILVALGPLALWLRERNPTAGVVPEQELLSQLTRYYIEDEDWGRGVAKEKAQKFLESVRRYSNLIVERGHKQYGFLHLTFEEMLAAYGLVQKGQLNLQSSLDLIQTHLTDPGWRETILLAVGVWGIANHMPRVAGKVVETMLSMTCPADQAGQNVLIAGACLEDVGEEGMGRTIAQKVQQHLLASCCNRNFPPATQRDAGFSLARTGWKPTDLDDFITVHTGQFFYGNEKQRLTIDKTFKISKYPVTNFQYLGFISANGYNTPEFWSNDGWAWRVGLYDGKILSDYRDWRKSRPTEKRHEPFFWNDRQWNNPLSPVVGVNWFEAEAYCIWLSKNLEKSIRLPTKEEWERAARGTDGREYPWGGKFDRLKTNCAEFWAGQNDLSNNKEWQNWFESESRRQASTTVIVQFPEGNSPDGLSDTSGNVWEWTNSWYDKTNRVLRGGAWSSVRLDVRCAYRGRENPDYFNDDIGFRIVVLDH